MYLNMWYKLREKSTTKFIDAAPETNSVIFGLIGNKAFKVSKVGPGREVMAIEFFNDKGELTEYNYSDVLCANYDLSLFTTSEFECFELCDMSVQNFARKSEVLDRVIFVKEGGDGEEYFLGTSDGPELYTAEQAKAKVQAVMNESPIGSYAKVFALECTYEVERKVISK